MQISNLLANELWVFPDQTNLLSQGAIFHPAVAGFDDMAVKDHFLRDRGISDSGIPIFLKAG